MTEVLTVGALGSTLMRRWKLITLFAVLGAVAGTAYGVVSPKAYTAKAVLVVMAGASEQSGFYQAAQFAEKRAATYPTLVTAPEVVDATRESLDLPYSSTALLAMVTATNPTDTPLVEVAAMSPSPTEAKEIADSIADNIAELRDRPRALRSPQHLGDDPEGRPGARAHLPDLSLVEHPRRPRSHGRRCRRHPPRAPPPLPPGAPSRPRPDR